MISIKVGQKMFPVSATFEHVVDVTLVEGDLLRLCWTAVVAEHIPGQGTLTWETRPDLGIGKGDTLEMAVGELAEALRCHDAVVPCASWKHLDL
jgi:hypothetical protein